MDKKEIEEILESDRPGKGDDIADGPEGVPSGGSDPEEEPRRSYGGGAPARRGGGGGAMPDIPHDKR
jgi:hypothetical protein